MRKLCSILCVIGVISVSSCKLTASLHDATNYMMKQYKTIQESYNNHYQQLNELDYVLEDLGL